MTRYGSGCFRGRGVEHIPPGPAHTLTLDHGSRHTSSSVSSPSSSVESSASGVDGGAGGAEVLRRLCEHVRDGAA